MSKRTQQPYEGGLDEVWTDPEQDYDATYAGAGGATVYGGTAAAPWPDRLRAGLSAAGGHLVRWLLCLTLAGFAGLVANSLGLTSRGPAIGGGALLTGSYAVFVWQARAAVAAAVADPAGRPDRVPRRERKSRTRGGRRG